MSKEQHNMISHTSGQGAVLYCRVSSKEQEEAGYSLPAQQKFLNEYAERSSLRVSSVFSISESANGKVKRKIFDEMMRYVTKHRISNLIVETTDRLTRNFSDVPVLDRWVLEDSNHRIHLAKEGCMLDKYSKSHEWFMWRVKVATAEYYVRLLSENVKKGQKERVSQGWLPTKPKLGYSTVGEAGHTIHAIDPKVSPYMVNMFERYATGNYSLARLDIELYRAGLRTESGRRVSVARIHRMLQDPFYYGKIRWSGGIHDGRHEPLISKNIFDKIGRVLKRKTENPHYRKHSPLFQAKVHCSNCGGVLTWEIQKGHWYGHCNNHGERKTCQKKTYIIEEKVEEQLVGSFKNLAPANIEVLVWIEELIREEEGSRIKEREQETAKLKSLLETTRRRVDRLYDDKLDEKIPPDFYQRKFAEYSAEEQTLKETLGQLNESPDQESELGIAIHQLGYHALDIYEKASSDEKRVLLSQIFSNLLQDTYEIRPNYTLAGKYLTDWTGRLNQDYEPHKNVMPQGKRKDLVLSSPSWREWRESLRTFKWREIISDLPVLLQEINQLLDIAERSDELRLAG